MIVIGVIMLIGCVVSAYTVDSTEERWVFGVMSIIPICLILQNLS